MRHKLLIASIAASAFATPALAQDATGNVNINGLVADRCLFTTPSEVINVGELALPGSGASAGRLDTSKLDGESRTLVGWCNGTAATMTVEALALFNVDFTSPAPTGFDRRVDYTADALANAVTATDSSTAASPGAGSPVPVGLFTGDVVVTLSSSSSPTNGLLIAGTYQGQVIVTLSPNVSGGDSGPTQE
ncbi:MAG TPA: hypothetical protein VGC46_07195 [Allosphingosinicella sp.]